MLLLGIYKLPRWDNFPYLRRELLDRRISSPRTIVGSNDHPKNSYPISFTPDTPVSTSINLPSHSREVFVPDFTGFKQNLISYRPPHSSELSCTPDYNSLKRLQNEFFPLYPHHGHNSSRSLPGFTDANLIETGNPHPFQPPLRSPGSVEQTKIDFNLLEASIKASNAPQAWLKFYEVRNSPLRIPVCILIDFIALICHKDTFNNWPDGFEKPDDILFILVNYLNINNFRDNEVFDSIMLAFSRIPTNNGLFRCLELLKSLSYIPSRNILLSIMTAYTNSDLNSKLLDLFPLLSKNSYTDPQMLNAFFMSIQPLFTTKRNQIMDILHFISKQNIVLPRESYILMIESFITVSDIPRALVVISTFPPRTQLENSHIECIIIKSNPLLIQKVFKFVEQLNDSQRSMLSQLCYSTLIDRSISSNYPYGISYLFGLCINFNKLVETSLITKLLEFLFRFKHTSQVTKIFKMIESFRTSDEQNSLTNIFLPPTMHKISQILIEYESFAILHTFVMIMLNEKIVPLKPVIHRLIQHLKAIKDNTKIKEIFDFAVKNELVFDEQLFNQRQDSQNTQQTHFIINVDSPTDEVTTFDLPIQELNKPMENEILISVMDRMVCTDIPHEHIFNHILVSLGHGKDSFNTFRQLLNAFIPGDPGRSLQSRSTINQILFRTAMRLTANFMFEKEWTKCVNFISLLNQSSLLNDHIEVQYSKELVQFLSSVIEVSIKEKNFTEIFKIFDKLNWPSFTLFDHSDIPQFKTQLVSLFTQCLEQVDLHNASRVIKYVLQEDIGENTKSCFVQLLGLASNLGDTNIALSLFTFMNTYKLEVTIDHIIYQKLITLLGQENKLHHAKMVFQHGVANSCYTAMLSIMASPSQVNLFSNLVPLEIKFLLEKRLQSLYNMHKDVLTESEGAAGIEPFEISFLRNILTTNRTAFQQAIRSLILMLSEEFIPPLIDNCSEYLKSINYLKIYKIQIQPKKLRQYLLDNFVADKDKPSDMQTGESSDSFHLDEDCKFTDSHFLTKSPLLFPDVIIKEEMLEDSFSANKPKPSILTPSTWICEVKRCINSKLSKYYWTGPIATKEDYNLIAKRVTKTFRENVKIPDAELVSTLNTDHEEIINTLIQEEMFKLGK